MVNRSDMQELSRFTLIDLPRASKGILSCCLWEYLNWTIELWLGHEHHNNVVGYM